MEQRSQKSKVGRPNHYRRFTCVKAVATFNKQINDTIKLLADRPISFSAYDVIAHTSLEKLKDTIEIALQRQCIHRAILKLGKQKNDTSPHCLYLGVSAAEKWWITQTIRWAIAKQDYLTPSLLARSMSLALLPPNDCPWETPPSSLLDIGQGLALVAEGCVPNTFVSPWAAVLRANPHFIESFCTIFASRLADLRHELSLDKIVDQTLNRLDDRQADIVRARFGIATEKATLEQLGRIYGITRERIRQIEKKAICRLCLPPYYQTLWLGFATDFIQSRGSLLLQELTPQHKLLAKCIKLNIVPINQLGLYIIGTKSVDLTDYLETFHDVGSISTNTEQTPTSIFKALQFLSHSDGIYLSEMEQIYQTKYIHKRRLRMLYEALCLLGRAAHYQEIAEKCKQLFPKQQNSARNWHAALCQPNAEQEYGIVWIGRKGMYGLKKHGYSRPNHDISESVAQIVEEIFSKTQYPVSFQDIMVKLNERRRELNPNSVKMALGFNDRLEAVENGNYLPKAHIPTSPNTSPDQGYDIDKAFSAFCANENSS